MKSKKRQKSLLSLDFLKGRKTHFHGMASGLVLMVLGWLVAVSLITLIGLVIFVPSFGAMVLKFLKGRVATR